MNLIAAIAAGGIGAVCRHLAVRRLSRLIPAELPIGVMAVNWAGALALGILTGTSPGPAVTAATVGFLGGFTTFSSWIADTTGLLSTRGARRLAALNLVLMLVGGLAFGLAGYALVR